MVLYLLTGTKGSWDLFSKYNVGIYDSLEKAEAEKQRIIEELTAIKNKYTPEQAKQYQKDIDDIFCLDEEELPEHLKEFFNSEEELPPHLQEFESWLYRWKFEEINLEDFHIEEIEVNKCYFNYDKAN